MLEWAEANDLFLPDRIANNLAIILFGWCMFLEYAEHLGVKPIVSVKPDISEGYEFEQVLSSIVEELMPGGKELNALDELVVFIAAMIANGRLKLGIHFTRREDNLVVLPLPAVLLEARKYSAETDKREILGEKAYRGIVKEAAKRSGSYVKATTAHGDFEDPETGLKQRRGVLLDPDSLEERLDIDPDIWGP